MNTFWIKVVSYLLIGLTLFTILFDPAGVALGSSIVTLPEFFITLASIIGNLLWLLGVVLFGCAGLYAWLLFDESTHEDVIEETLEYNLKNGQNIQSITPFSMRDKDEKPVFYELTNNKMAFRWFTVVCSFVAIGSGFWFTGTGWLLAIIAGIYYSAVGIELSEKLIKQRKRDMIDE